MLRGFALKCLEPVRGNSLSCTAIWRNKQTVVIPHRYYERFRRSGDGRKREWFEEKSAANQEEYFRKITARQLKEIRERSIKKKAECEAECKEKCDKKCKEECKEQDEKEATSTANHKKASDAIKCNPSDDSACNPAEAGSNDAPIDRYLHYISFSINYKLNY
ncbi:uncharacterized protein PF07_0086-like [Apis laboriosa]|uniref:uncharacterized protein PF07_0086-like n=1 Tax=Apis laboriosa TaxID=183418 RepID=UPI001CC72965|nr:uncharacterized protein PF07_0086-like [Apis laboriosa]